MNKLNFTHRAVHSLRQCLKFARFKLSALLLLIATVPLLGMAQTLDTGRAENTLSETPQPASVESWDFLYQQFDNLKFLGYFVILGAAVLGAAIYYYRHKNFLPRDWSYSAMAAILLSGIMLWLLTAVILTPESATCLTGDLRIGVQAEAYDDACRAARENLANITGGQDVYRLFSSKTKDGIIVPISSAGVLFLSYFSVMFAALVLCWVFRFLIRTLYFSKQA